MSRAGGREAALEALVEAWPGQSLWRLLVPLPTICVWRSPIPTGGVKKRVHAPHNNQSSERVAAVVASALSGKCRPKFGRGGSGTRRRSHGMKDTVGVGERRINRPQAAQATSSLVDVPTAAPSTHGVVGCIERMGNVGIKSTVLVYDKVRYGLYTHQPDTVLTTAP
eukprot:scaffold73363_cov60-Phaeocystis_antarctica.AAC.7